MSDKKELLEYFYQKLDDLKKRDVDYWKELLIAFWELGEPNKVIWDTIYKHITKPRNGRCFNCNELVDHLFDQPDAESFIKELM
jgi:hypothetical protein